MPDITTIAFDADDTLWHNERHFRLTVARFADLLADHAPADHLQDRLLAAERRNLARYGYGVKGFVLSMIETAIEVTDNRVPASVIRDLIDAGHEMLTHPTELLPGVNETILALKGSYRLIIVTKGDLLDQQRKVADSGLGDHFDAVEVVADKTAPVYDALFRRHGVPPDHAVMVGNSLKSDVIPVLEIGGWGVHVPHDLTWALEQDMAPTGHPRFAELRRLGDLPQWLAA
jgi:putative hydrolase of the HAD superfamily